MPFGLELARAGDLGDVDAPFGLERASQLDIRAAAAGACPVGSRQLGQVVQPDVGPHDGQVLTIQKILIRKLSAVAVSDLNHGGGGYSSSHWWQGQPAAREEMR